MPLEQVEKKLIVVKGIFQLKKEVWPRGPSPETVLKKAEHEDRQKKLGKKISPKEINQRLSCGDLCPGRKTCKETKRRKGIQHRIAFLLLNKWLFAALNVCTFKIKFCNTKDINMISSLQFC